MKIVLDTTEFFRNYDLSGSAFATLIDFARTSSHTLTIPRVVVDETKRHYAEDLSHAIGETKKWASTIRQLLAVDQSVSVSQAAEQFGPHFDSLLAKNGFEIADYPPVPHAVLVTRALSGKKPFTDDGRVGYRDALIWETLAELLLNTEEPVVFITRNTRDFMCEGGLHADLIECLCERSVPPDRISVYGSISAFVDQVIKPELKSTRQVQAYLSQDPVKASIESLVAKAMPRWFEQMQPSASDWGFPRVTHDLRLEEVNDVEMHGTTSTKRLSDQRILADVDVIARCELTLRIPVDGSRDQYSVLRNELWPNGFQMSIPRAVRLNVSVVYDDQVDAVDSVEITRAQHAQVERSGNTFEVVQGGQLAHNADGQLLHDATTGGLLAAERRVLKSGFRSVTEALRWGTQAGYILPAREIIAVHATE